MNRREFLGTLAAAAACGAPLNAARAQVTQALYDVPPFGNVSLLHFTDCHAQLLPTHFREPSANIGVGEAAGRFPHLVGEHLLRAAGIKPGSSQAHAFTYLDFAAAAKRYGKIGGFAHLATLVKRLRASRPNALLLDGGDTWQGSATSLWTRGQDMIDTCQQLGVDLMTAHWEFTYGDKRVLEAVKSLGRIEFLAQNVKTSDFGDPVFKPYVMREMSGVQVASSARRFRYAHR
jgi:sulfur-oxidizing protein SoxB